MLQISGTDLINLESLLVDIVSESGRLLEEGIEARAMPDTKGIIRGQIKTPNGKFKIQLKGKMKNGQNFTRLSQTSFKASNIVVLTIKAGNDYTATVSNRTAPIRVYLYSKAPSDRYTLTATSNYGSVSVSPSYVQLDQGRNTTVSLQHTLPYNAANLIGKLVTITLKVTMTRSVERKDHQIQMMYVP